MSFELSSTSGLSAPKGVVGAQVLVVDADEKVRSGAKAVLEQAELIVTGVADPEEAWPLFRDRFFSVALVDLDTPHPNVGIETAITLRELSPATRVVMLTPRKSFDDAVRCLRAGALDVVLKAPSSREHLVERVTRAAHAAVVARESDSLLDSVRENHETFLKKLMASDRRVLELESGGTGPTSQDLRVVIVSGSPAVAKALQEQQMQGFQLEAATSGGQGLDMASSRGFQVALVSNALEDLPASMVARSLLAQDSGMYVYLFDEPGLGARLARVKPTGETEIVASDLLSVNELVRELTALRSGLSERERERRYVQDFRERNYDFLRRFALLKQRIQRALTR